MRPNSVLDGFHTVSSGETASSTTWTMPDHKASAEPRAAFNSASVGDLTFVDIRAHEVVLCVASGSLENNARFPEIKLGLFVAPLFGRPLESNLGFAGQLSPYVVVMLPFCFLVLVSGSLAMLLQLRWPWRFTLRSLFIVTTFLAVVLGMMAWLDRAWIGK
jgi:hypothetical protein